MNGFIWDKVNVNHPLLPLIIIIMIVNNFNFKITEKVKIIYYKSFMFSLNKLNYPNFHYLVFDVIIKRPN